MQLSALVLPLLVSFVAAQGLGDLCYEDGTPGVCAKVSYCDSYNGYSGISNLCPDAPDDVKCCFGPECYAPYKKSGDFCQDIDWVHADCHDLGGHYITGHCPGPSNYKCCVT